MSIEILLNYSNHNLIKYRRYSGVMPYRLRDLGELDMARSHSNEGLQVVQIIVKM